MTPTDTDRRLAEIVESLRNMRSDNRELSELAFLLTPTVTPGLLMRAHDDLAFLLGLVEQQGREILRLQGATSARVFAEVAAERERQEAKWGEQNHPWHVPGLSAESARAELRIPSSTEARDYVQALADYGLLSYSAILLEEVCEAVDESDDTLARHELIQVAAVAVAAVEAIDRRAPHTIASPPSAPEAAPDFLPGDRIVYYPSGREHPGHLGTVRTLPRRLGDAGPWVVNLYQMGATYKRGECSIVGAAACDALDLVERPIASPPSSPVPPVSAGSAPASLSCTPTGSEGGHGLRPCPDCGDGRSVVGRADRHGCTTCGGARFVGVP